MKRDEQACTAVPFHDGLAEHLTQIARIIHTELRKVLADEDLSAVESGVIMCLSTTKVDTAGRIARRMGVSRSLMSKAVDHLVRGGWIETKPDQNDRRMVHLVLLPKAEPAVKRCRELKHEYYEKMCAGVSPEDMQVFHRTHHGAFSSQSGCRHHTGGHFSSALPAHSVYPGSSVWLGKHIHIHCQVYAGHVIARYFKFF